MALLAHLALSERPRPRETLCELLWADLSPDRGRAALRRTLSSLRSGIGEASLDTAGDSVTLRTSPGLTLDLVRFRALAADGSVDALLEAVTIFAGEFLEGFYLRRAPEFELWQAEQAEALRRELSSALGRLVRLLGARGQAARAIPFARRWLALDPLHEPAHRELIRVYAWSGERAAAMHQYRECVRALSRELGVAPLGETTSLFEQVSEGTLQGPAPAPAEARPAKRRDRSPTSASPGLPMVGRNTDFAHALKEHHRARTTGRLVVIEGEAGIGKTRLAAELVRHVRSEGGAVVRTRCHQEEVGVAYGAVAELLREVHRTFGAEGWAREVGPARVAEAASLVPELGSLLRPDAPLSAAGPGAQSRLLDGVTAVLAAAVQGPEPGMILVEDVHAADAASLDVLAYLARRLPSRRLLLVLTWRSEALGPTSRLRRLRADLRREGAASSIALGRLGLDSVRQLVAAAGLGEEEDLVGRVLSESEGLPLLVCELLAALISGEPEEARAGGVLSARLAGLPEPAGQVLGAAAVVGRRFSFDVVREVSGRAEEETVAAVDELIARGVVSEGKDGVTYSFCHERLREVVLSELSLIRERLLHRRVAAALEARAGGSEGSAVIALHLREAGDHAAAARHYHLAGEQAAALHAHVDALDHFEAALALGDPQVAVLYERIGDLQTLEGTYAAARDSYDRAAAQAEPARRPFIERKLGVLYHRRGEWERAEARFRVALAAGSSGPALRARVMADLSLTLHHAGRQREAAELALTARREAGHADDPLALAQAHNLLGVLAHAAGDLSKARAQLEQSLALADAIGDPSVCVAALNNLALARRAAGELDPALELTRQALELCHAYGDRHREAALHNNLADLHHEAGRVEESMVHLKQAASLFADIGADENERLPEIWKLVAW